MGRLVFPWKLWYPIPQTSARGKEVLNMNLLRRRGVLPFLLAEGALYGAFLWRDLSPGGAGSTPLKYAAILLCALFALLWALLGGGDRLTAAALLLAAGADTFLLALDRDYLLGMLLFCGVQLCWFLRLRALCRRSFWAARLGLFLLSLGALAALGLWNFLNVLSLFYFANFACNTALSLSRRWEGPLRLLPPGLVLYLCCDLCVAAFQFPQALPALYPFVQVGMWLFYLPGQVLLALSGLPLSGQKLSRGDRL